MKAIKDQSDATIKAIQSAGLHREVIPSKGQEPITVDGKMIWVEKPKELCPVVEPKPAICLWTIDYKHAECVSGCGRRYRRLPPLNGPFPLCFNCGKKAVVKGRYEETTQ